MSAPEGGPKAEHKRHFVDRILENTQRYAHELLAENERLRLLVRSLEDERSKLAERNGILQGIDRENQALQSLLGSIEQEKERLQEQLRALREEGERQQQEQSLLREELVAIELRGRHLAQQFETIERQNSNLANLYVATYQLHGAHQHAEVLASIQEILVNLVGSEHAGVFEVADGGRTLVASSLNGIDPVRYGSIELGQGPLGRAAASGELLLLGAGGEGEPPVEEPELTACVPLKLSGELIGMIVVFELLPQKPGLEDIDRELFELLATHAATALYCTSLRERLAARPAVAS